MLLLAIESSCDETSVAVIQCRASKTRTYPPSTIIAHHTYSQIALHKKTQGVVPEVAAREHVKKIMPLLTDVLKEADISLPLSGRIRLDAVAVTSGPGLVTSLNVGLETAKALSLVWNIPLIGVNHLEGHIFSALIEKAKRGLDIRLPALALIVSGGHTELVLIKKWGSYQLLGHTLDDAVGEAFDKVAKLLRLGYPGGPIVSQMAAKGDDAAIDFPRPMLQSRDYHFSFSGLKTAVLYHVQHEKLFNGRVPTFRRNQAIVDICASFQRAVVDVLTAKTAAAIKHLRIKSLILAGGVAANQLLREELRQLAENSEQSLDFYLPSQELATDNAAMIGAAAVPMLLKKHFSDLTRLQAQPRQPLSTTFRFDKTKKISYTTNIKIKNKNKYGGKNVPRSLV